MLKTLPHRATNEKCCSVEGGRWIYPLFSSPPISQLKSPHPREFAIQGQKKMLMPGGGGGWAQLELTDA